MCLGLQFGGRREEKWRSKAAEGGRAAGKSRMAGMRFSTDKFYFMFVVQ